jgi:exoribonuclease-2
MDMQEVRHRTILQRIAHRVMLERGLLPDFSGEVIAEVEALREPAFAEERSARDLRELAWCSIDNDDSLDLDQLTVAASLPGGRVKVMVATADVALLVADGTAIDGHARHNTTSVYTAGEKFPMLPDRLSTDLSSLNQDEDRMVIVVDMVLDDDGRLKSSDIYRAMVRNHAKLTYRGVGAWLEATGPMPDAVAAVPGLAENLRMQDTAAQDLKQLRQSLGALSLQTIQSRPVFEGDMIRGLEVELKNRATELIENFMIAANGVTVRFLASRNFPCIRRVVHTPRRWDRIVEVAAEQGTQLPLEPDPKALEAFLVEQKKANPATFPDLSLTIIKLLGPGEYVAQAPGEGAEGHFGLAVRDYTHSTAPNRRYPDLITQRLLKATLSGSPAPYAYDDLAVLATHCTEQEDAANKTERQVGKSAAALLLRSRIGEQFDAIVTGASPKGTWVRLFAIPIEGRVVQGFEGLDVGHRTRVQLESVDIDRGFIDFRRVRR